MTYQKLFPIEYNNKRFMIFLDECNRRTFLEIDSKGEYAYPVLEDFLSLNKIFNNREPFICYNVQKFTFKEKVKVIKGTTISLLTVLIMLNNMPRALASEIKAEVKDDNIVVSEEVLEDKVVKESVIINDIKDLNQYLGYKRVTKELVLNAINNNPNLNTKYKRIAKNLLNAIIEKYPNTDLRIFYENIKTMEIKEYTIEEFHQAFPEAVGAGAQYNAKLNRITAINELPVELLYHEMYHSFHTFYQETEKNRIYRYEPNVSLDEALTDKGASLVIPIKEGYVLDGLVLDFLMSLVDYDLEDYNNKGVNDLINKLKKKYPDIDFNYICEVLNTMNSYIIYEGKKARIEDCEELGPLLFKMCLQEASLSKGYEPFSKFAKLFYQAKDPELIFSYLERYNERLNSLGYKKIINMEEVKARFSIYKDATGIGYNEKECYPICFTSEEKSKINNDGTKIEIEAHNYSNTFDFPSLISANMFSKYETFGTNDYWKDLALENGLINPYLIKEIPIYKDGKLITTMNSSNLSLTIGETSNHKIGYKLTDFKTGNIIYQSDKILENESNSVHFNYYISKYSRFIERLDLEDVLNEDYLKMFQTKTGYIKNMTINNGNIEMEPRYSLTILTDTTMANYELADCIVKSNSGIIYIDNTDFSFPCEYELESSISLKDILKHYNYLNKNVKYYTIKAEDLINFITNYVKELNVKRGR